MQLYTPTYPLNAAERLPALGSPLRQRRAKPIAIGDRCWIGGGAIVMPGVTIDPRTTIGAGSVVTQSIPADCPAVGNPCRAVRRLDERIAPPKLGRRPGVSRAEIASFRKSSRNALFLPRKVDAQFYKADSKAD